MRKWLILLLALCATTASSAPAWTWVDANGTVHFSDRPVPGARQVELGGAQSFGAQTAADSAVRSSTGAPTEEPTGDSTTPYRSIDIVSPAEQETLWNIGGMLNVLVRFQPALLPGHRYDLVLDGQRRNVNTGAARVTLSEVFRGTHTLQVIVLDASGSELMRSPTRSFIVQQTSVQNPNSAIARPRPRPAGN